MLLKTSEEYYNALTKLAALSDECILSSFGVYCNIVHGADLVRKQKKSFDRIFLNSIADHPNMTVIVGVLDYYTASRNENCKNCEIAFAKRTIRNEKHRELFPNINWLMCDSLHSKFFSMKKGNGYFGVVGSRNFTGSENFELAVTVEGEDAKDLYAYAHMLKNRSIPVSVDSVLNKCLKEIGNPDFLEFV